jgi:hypothetical protein
MIPGCSLDLLEFTKRPDQLSGPAAQFIDVERAFVGFRRRMQNVAVIADNEPSLVQLQGCGILAGYF